MSYDEGWRQQQIAIEKLKADGYACPWCGDQVFLGDTLIATCKCGAVFDGRNWPRSGWTAPPVPPTQ